jgi:hypothetical protein
LARSIERAKIFELRHFSDAFANLFHDAIISRRIDLPIKSIEISVIPKYRHVSSS